MQLTGVFLCTTLIIYLHHTFIHAWKHNTRRPLLQHSLMTRTRISSTFQSVPLFPLACFVTNCSGVKWYWHVSWCLSPCLSLTLSGHVAARHEMICLSVKYMSRESYRGVATMGYPVTRKQSDRNETPLVCLFFVCLFVCLFVFQSRYKYKQYRLLA